MLRKLFSLIALILLVTSCNKPHPTHYMSVSGKFENITEKDSILFISGASVRKRIKINSDGTFQDSLRIIKPNYYTINVSGNRAYLWLSNGYDLNFTGNKQNLFKSLKFSGKDEGAHSNQLIVDQYVFGQSAGNVQGFVILEKEAFLEKVEKYKKGMDSLNSIYPNADKDLVDQTNKQNKSFFDNLVFNYEKAHPFYVERRDAMERLKPGNPAPEFTNYENYKGGKNSLSDYRGKYVYIDVWATWCTPCMIQVPYLKKLQKRFKGKNIEFISLSTDSKGKSAKTWKGARDQWKKMIKEKDLSGTHLWAGEKNSIHKDYFIQGIPRFILIDKEGKLISYNARRPSDPKLGEILEDLLQ